MLTSQQNAVEHEDGLDVARLGVDLPAAAVNAIADIGRKFTNQRQWREFISAVQCSVNYPAAINSLRSGTRWFSDGLAQASACLARTLRVAPRNR
ncbi:MAG TPA: hypothetical protein VHW71_17835 [Steroidobacteraceae bacterium]|jgi:hypothetical protein|nr:hypothetical protein [Steroidobacteraceae bacterium]